jgi:DNA-binding GntR family transcriptional regulator
MRKTERRNSTVRSALLQSIVNSLLQNPSVTLTVETLQAWVGLSRDAAERILMRLADSGLVREIRKGVFVRGTWPGAVSAWR